MAEFGVVDVKVIDSVQFDDAVTKHYGWPDEANTYHGKGYSSVRAYPDSGNDSYHDLDMHCDENGVWVTDFDWDDNDEPCTPAQTIQAWVDAGMDSDDSPNPMVIVADLINQGALEPGNYAINTWW